MVENVLKPLLLAVSVILTCILIGYSVYLTNSGQRLAISVNDSIAQTTSAMYDSKLSQYAADSIPGSDIIGCIKKNRDDVSITVLKKVSAGVYKGDIWEPYDLGAGSSSYTIQDREDKSGNKYEKSELALTMDTQGINFPITLNRLDAQKEFVNAVGSSNPYYINPNGTFKGSIIRNSNGVITGLLFMQNEVIDDTVAYNGHSNSNAGSSGSGSTGSGSTGSTGGSGSTGSSGDTEQLPNTSVQEQYSQLSNSIALLQTAIEELSAKVGTGASNVTAENDDYATKDELKSEFVNYNAQIADLLTKLQNLAKSMGEMHDVDLERFNSVDEQIADLQTRVDNLAASLLTHDAEIKETIAQLEDKVNAMNNLLGQYNTKLNELANKVGDLSGTVGGLSGTVGNLTNSVGNLSNVVGKLPSNPSGSGSSYYSIDNSVSTKAYSSGTEQRLQTLLGKEEVLQEQLELSLKVATLLNEENMIKNLNEYSQSLDSLKSATKAMIKLAEMDKNNVLDKGE